MGLSTATKHYNGILPEHHVNATFHIKGLDSLIPFPQFAGVLSAVLDFDLRLQLVAQSWSNAAHLSVAWYLSYLALKQYGWSA